MNPNNIQDLLSHSFEEFRINVAISCGNQSLTYNELENRSNRLASSLLTAGASKGDIVAILSQDSIEAIIAMIGIMMAGCVFVPLSPEFPKQQLDTIVSEISPQWFIVNSKTIHTLSDLNDMHTLQSKVICMDKSKVSEQDKYNFNLIDYEEHPGLKKVMVRLEMDDMCYIYFTSGSTGKPKGIAGRLKSIAHFISWEIQTFNVRELMRFSQLTTPIFDAFMRDVFVPLCSGGVICIPEDTDIILDSRKLLDWIDHQQINLIHCVPSLFRSILSGDLTAAKLLDLNYVLLAGEPLLPVDLVRWMDIYGERIQLVNLYGPSETTMTKLFYFIQPSDQERRSIPIGKPMQGATAVIVDEKQEICPPGMAGLFHSKNLH